MTCVARCLSEQNIVENEIWRFRTKEDGIWLDMIQIPSDSEATFHRKSGKEHRGYMAKLEESARSNGSVVIEYQYAQNIHSDSQFIHGHLDRMDVQEEKAVMVANVIYLSP